MTSYTIAELAERLGFQAAGDLSVRITAPSEPHNAMPDHLAMAMEKSYAEGLEKGSALAAMLWPEADWQAYGLKAAIFAPYPRYAMSKITETYSKAPLIDTGIAKTAIIHPDAEIGDGASIGHYVMIGKGAKIGKNAVILPHCSIAENVVIGDEALLYQGVKIGSYVTIGDHFIAQPGAVIGADGFSFVTPEPGNIDEARQKGEITSKRSNHSYARIYSIASVEIGNHVEVGANSCIDKGTIANTRIGTGVKIDNLVQIGHNVKIGNDCLVCGQAAIGGSSEIGDRVVLGGQSAVADHLRIGSDVVVTGQTGVSAHVSSGKVMMGTPAVRMDQAVEQYKSIRRLPRIMAKLDELQKLVSKLEKKE